MNDRQENAFWETMTALNELKLLPYVAVMGSWAEYLYQNIFEEDYTPVIQTRDIDLMYDNIRRPENHIPLATELTRRGFVYDEDPTTGTGRFYKGTELELEFLTQALGAGTEHHIKIEPIGIVSDSIRDVNIFHNHLMTITKNGMDILVPSPAVFVIQKILINNHRVPIDKREKDMEAVRRILIQLRKDEVWLLEFHKIYDLLSKKQLSAFDETISRYGLDLSGIIA